MVVKELMATVYHLDALFTRADYMRRYQLLVQAFSAERDSLTQDFSRTLDTLDQIQTATIQYEERFKFPFEGNGYLGNLGIQHLVGIGALENLKDLVTTNPGEADKVIAVAYNKLSAAGDATSSLKRALEKMPGYKEARDMFRQDAQRVVVRFVLPAVSHQNIQSATEEFKQLSHALRAIGRLNKSERDRDFEVLAFSHSSPENLLFIVSATTALTLNSIVKAALSRWKQIEEIRNIRAQTEKLKLESDVIKAKLLADLTKAEESVVGDRGELAKKLVAQHATDLDGEASEIEGFVSSSVGYIEELVNNGGTVNVYLLPDQQKAASPDHWQQELISSRKLQGIKGKPQAMIQDGDEHSNSSTE